MTEEELQQKRDEIEAELRSRYADDPELFIRNLYIPSADGKRLFENCKTDFQMETFADLLPAIKAIRDGEQPQHQRFWIERTKKASKDADLAAAVVWLVAYAKRPIYGQIAAADKDQAAIIKRRIEDLLFYNPWMTDLLEIQSYKIQSRSNQLAKIDIIAADVAGSHGETPDLLVVNELSHVTKWEFVENLLSNAAGVKRGVVVVATNAGFRGTKAWTWREIAIKEWKTYIYARPAPWHSQAFVDDERKRTTSSRFKRLWWGVWASGKGDALSEEDVDRVFVHGLKEITRPEPGYTYLVGLDLGVNHDHAAVVVVGVHEQKRLIRVANMRYWEPPTGGEIDLDAVKDHVAGLYRLFHFRAMLYDTYQAVLMAQQLRKTGVPCREMTFTPKNLDAMATALKQVIENGVLQSYDDDGRLRADFGKFNLVEKTYGLRLEAVSDETGHADVGTALVIVLPAAVEMLDFGSDRLQPDDELVYDGKDLTKQEVAELPPELKAIYEAYDDLDLRGLTASKRPKLSEMEYFGDEE